MYTSISSSISGLATRVLRDLVVRGTVTGRLLTSTSRDVEASLVRLEGRPRFLAWVGAGLGVTAARVVILRPGMVAIAGVGCGCVY